MTLVVFDMDGTLLNGKSEITPFTAETLTRMRDAGIAYTVATGRTLQAALGPLKGHGFKLPHIFLRFELTPEQISALKAGGELYAGIDHPAYTIEKFAVEAVIKDSLSNDLTQTTH